MKTKFVKVSVSERLPEKNGFYHVIKDPDKFDKIQIDRYTVESMEFIGDNILFWLEEVPDREDEMIIELQKVKDEREAMIKAFSEVSKEFEGRQWIVDGRGPYTYNDDEYKKEVTYLFNAFDTLKSEMWSKIKSNSFDYRFEIEKPLKKQIDEMTEFLKQLVYGCENGLISDLEELGENSKKLLNELKQTT